MCFFLSHQYTKILVLFWPDLSCNYSYFYYRKKGWGEDKKSRRSDYSRVQEYLHESSFWKHHLIPKKMKFFLFNKISLLIQNFCHLFSWYCFDMKCRKSTLPCFAMVSIRKSILTLSTLGTRIELYSGVPLLGYTYSSTCVFQCIHVPIKKGMKSMF